MARIESVGTAVPAHAVAQGAAKAAAREIFREMPRREELLAIFDHAGVERRYFCFGPEYYGRSPGFGRRNDDYIERATDLAVEACRDADVEAGAVDHVIFVTTTGLATPSIDARLAGRLGMRPDVRRTPVYGVGCAGGAVGLARAHDYLRAYPERRVLLVSVELCGQTFDPADLSTTNVVAAAVFGDGAAAVSIGGDRGPRIADADSLMFPDSLDVMGWDFRDSGPRLVLSKEIPDLIRRETRAAVERFLKRNGLSLADVRHVVAHPGGPKVIAAIHDALGLSNGALDPSRRLLREYGNLSSASVLFILKEVLPRIGPGEPALVMAVGPGFCLEQALLIG